MKVFGPTVDNFPSFILAGSLGFLALVFGGATKQGYWSDAIVQFASLPLLTLVALSLRRSSGSRVPFVLIGLLFLLPLVQLIPLPPSWWSLLPGRELAAKIYLDAGVPTPWLPISLVPSATSRSAIALLPAVAIFAAMPMLGAPQRFRILLMGGFIVAASVGLDLLQMIGGPSSYLRFFSDTNPERAVGFFANSNHNAAFLYCAIPFAAMWAKGLRVRHSFALWPPLLAVIVLIGVAVAQSRAGLILALLAGVFGVPQLTRDGVIQSRMAVISTIGLGALVAFLVLIQFGFEGLGERLQLSDIGSDLRWPVAAATLKAALSNLPFGTGYGTFMPVYQTFEPHNILSDSYMNRAHDDWLESLLEGGLLSVAAILAFLLWFIPSTVRAWRKDAPGSDASDQTLARAGSIVVFLLMLHSVVDYPLRTTALAVVFAFSCGLLIRPRNTLHTFPASGIGPSQPHVDQPRSGTPESR
jgi:O-antigen ligase